MRCVKMQYNTYEHQGNDWNRIDLGDTSISRSEQVMLLSSYKLRLSLSVHTDIFFCKMHMYVFGRYWRIEQEKVNE
jgi:hypothetical protein